MPLRRPALTASATVLALAVLLPGCGGDGGTGAQSERPAAAKLRERLNGATEPRPGQFPRVAGRTLQKLADASGAAPAQAGLATSVFTPGPNRLAFGVLDSRNKFVYGPTAVYLARGPNGKARGPFVAPADLLVTEPPFRSRQAATDGDPFAAIYQATVDLTPGRWSVLALTRLGNRLAGAPTQVRVVPEARSTVVPVGAKAPVVDTETLTEAGGNVEAIDTRVPPDDMHDVNLRDVIGKKPVAVVFATPQLCESRVCGPVVDIAAQLKQRYGDRMAFIHQEVYTDNDPKKGLRVPLRRFGLQTEPWLFVIDRQGRVAARLEGSFGLDAFEKAVQDGLA